MLNFDFTIWNIQGILMYQDCPVIDFCITDRVLVYAKDLSNKVHYPWALWQLGLTYEGFNLFFNDRVVRRNAQDMDMYLSAMEMKYYDPELLVKKTNGWNALDYHWVKFPDFGARSWKDIKTQQYPVI